MTLMVLLPWSNVKVAEIQQSKQWSNVYSYAAEVSGGIGGGDGVGENS
jgi:hypothetical protein